MSLYADLCDRRRNQADLIARIDNNHPDVPEDPELRRFVRRSAVLALDSLDKALADMERLGQFNVDDLT